MLKPPPKPELVDSEWALAQNFLHHNGRDLNWIHERRLWIRWVDFIGWREDDAGVCLSEIQKMGVETWVRKNAVGDLKPAPSTGGRYGVAMGALKSAAPLVSSSLNSWDVNPEIIGVKGARKIDLRTMQISDMTRDDRIRQQIPCAPDFDVPEDCRWRLFLEESIPDIEARRYLLRLAGYSMTGYTREHVIPFLYGPPRTGKSTFYNAIREAMGDYANVSSTSNYSRNMSNHKTFYAKLANSRAVFLDEIPRGFQLNEGLVKSITGGEDIEANFMRGNSFEFTPRFCLWFIGNNAPTMSERDGGLLARIKIVPFKNQPEHKNLELPHILRGDEQKYVVADMVSAAAEYLESGLGAEPGRVAAAMKEYAATADTLSLFLEEVLDPAPFDMNLPRRDLWEAYKLWTEDARQKRPYGKNGFFRALREGDYSVADGKLAESVDGPNVVYAGVELKSNYANRI